MLTVHMVTRGFSKTQSLIIDFWDNCAQILSQNGGKSVLWWERFDWKGSCLLHPAHWTSKRAGALEYHLILNRIVNLEYSSYSKLYICTIYIYVVQVLDYYGKFKKTGDPLKSPIDQAEFLQIMQVETKQSVEEENLPKMSNSKRHWSIHHFTTDNILV